MKRTLLTFAALCLLAAPAAAAPKSGSAFGVTITSCVVNSNGGNLTNGINVVYYNTHDSPATEVDFLVNYQKHKYILIDKGNFGRGAQINHNLTNALTGQPWEGPTPKKCSVQRVYLANGNVLQ
ncbi:MAG TPA: hypothetical protein VN909_04350 [Candidatus Dormibacteraeota bacterium]|jgi:hypothetical protein|nr:hypothetical protein [Candidatus Dormibacteraeota bacterium]